MAIETAPLAQRALTQIVNVVKLKVGSVHCEIIPCYVLDILTTPIYFVFILDNNLTVNSEFFLLGFKNGQRSTIFLFCLLLVIYCGTIFGNLLIIILVSTSKNLHTPMYFFLSQLSISDILLPTDIVPNMFHILLNNGGFITVNGCIIQFYFFCASEGFECFLLTVMSYDRYVAICNPLRYISVMTSDRSVILAAICWLLAFSITLMYCITISMLTFCGPNIIDHFFCDLVPLLESACSSTYTIEMEVFIMCLPIVFIPLTVIIISYINIIVTILQFQSNISRQKSFSTCSSHLIVVSIFYFTLLSVYLFPKGEETLNFSKLLSLLYTVVTPLINPIIYSLRNKDIKKSLQEMINKCAKFRNDLMLMCMGLPTRDCKNKATVLKKNIAAQLQFALDNID
ncbi:olfactory receptor 1496-like [Phyllobates terribilis]|uniref:olfactory receptor 1496-like n=1 Tax=Phyllobates terribilis TaxID=111132 RepID=UPI003CCB4B04